MQTVLTSEFKRGMVLLLDGAPQMLEEFHVSGTAQTRHKLHARLRHLKTGRIPTTRFPKANACRSPTSNIAVSSSVITMGRILSSRTWNRSRK